MEKPFLNFQVDHTTLFVEPRFYNVAYLTFRVVFGVGPEDIIYEKRRKFQGQSKEESMTFAARIGRGAVQKSLGQSILAIVQPAEPEDQPSHVRQILRNRGGSMHCFHIALRTPDLIAFHRHAKERGVNFITPIMKDAEEDLIQVFSGEWFLPGRMPSGFFFEFVQRNPTESLLKKLEEHNRESWFRDKTFMGLYDEKEREYRSGRVTPFIDADLFDRLYRLVGSKKVWEIGDVDVRAAEKAMLEYARSRNKRPAAKVG